MRSLNLLGLLALQLLIIFGSHKALQQQALASPKINELGAAFTPIYGKLTAQGKSYTFFSVLGGMVQYRYALTGNLWLETAYEAQSSGRQLLFHGPDLAISYALFGRPSVDVADEPLTLTVTYPLVADIGLGTWVREYDFSGVFPESAKFFSTTNNLVKKGTVLGGQVFIGASFELNNNLRIFGRLRYLTGSAANLNQGAVWATSLQCGLLSKL